MPSIGIGNLKIWGFTSRAVSSNTLDGPPDNIIAAGEISFIFSIDILWGRISE